MTCLLPTLGPAGGLCTTACTTNDDCGAGACFDVLPNATTKYCVEKCSFGPTTGTVLDPNKCRGRADMACMPSDGGVCRPLCNSDADCSPLYCDPGSGLCTQAPPTGDPIGAPCNPGSDSCKGDCVALTGTSGLCVAACTVGVTPSCGMATGTTSRAWCQSGVVQGLGDSSVCLAVCDCTAQCVYAGVMTAKCVQLDPAQQQAAGGKGVCLSDDAPGTEITVCQ